MKKFSREYCHQLYATILDNLDKMENFLEIHNLQNL